MSSLPKPSVSLREIHPAPFHSQLSAVIIRTHGAASLTPGLLLFNPSNTGLGSFLKCKQWWALLHKLLKAIRMGKLIPQHGSQGLHRPRCFCLHCPSWSSCPSCTVFSKLEWSLWAFRHAVPSAWNLSPQPLHTLALLFFNIFLKSHFLKKAFSNPPALGSFIIRVSYCNTQRWYARICLIAFWSLLQAIRSYKRAAGCLSCSWRCAQGLAMCLAYSQFPR